MSKSVDDLSIEAANAAAAALKKSGVAVDERGYYKLVEAITDLLEIKLS